MFADPICRKSSFPGWKVVIIKICRHDRVYITGNESGVLAIVGDNGTIDYYGRICDWEKK